MNETESFLARIASLEAELAVTHKRRAAIEAMEAYKAYATVHAQEIAEEAADLIQIHTSPHLFPCTAEFLDLRNKADRLRKEIQP